MQDSIGENACERSTATPSREMVGVRWCRRPPKIRRGFLPGTPFSGFPYVDARAGKRIFGVAHSSGPSFAVTGNCAFSEISSPSPSSREPLLFGSVPRHVPPWESIMPVRMTCECGNAFKVPDTENGKKVRCPSCKKVLVVGAVPVTAGQGAPGGEDSAVSSSGAKPKVKSSAGAKPARSTPTDQSDEFSTLERSREAAPVIQGFAKPKKKPRPEGVDAERKKKKRTNNQPPAWVMALSVLFMVGVVGGAVYVGMQANKADKAVVVAPQNFERFVASEKFFSLDKPEGFEGKTGGGTGGVPINVVFKKDSILIDIRSSPKGASIADIAGASSQGQELPPDEALEQAPAGKVHRFHQAAYEDQFSGYEEGTMSAMKTPYGDARIADFTAKSMLGSKTFGTRITIVGVQFQLNMICTCTTEKAFQAYKPVFRRIAESLGGGG